MQLCEIGYFSKTHGVKGQLVLRTRQQFDETALKALIVADKGARVPYFVSDLRPANHGWVVSLEDITSVEDAKKLLNKPVFVDESLVEAEENDDDLSGYRLDDTVKGTIGVIRSVENHGAQELFVVDHNGTELLLPAADELIDEIDDEQRIVHYHAPEGLIDMLLGRG